MIASKNVNISEGEKLDALLRWINYDSERTKILAEMLKSIKLSKVPAANRRYLIEHESLINNNKDRLLLFSISIMNTMKVGSKPFGNFSTKTAVLLFDANSGHLQCFNPTDNTLTPMHAMNDDMKKSYFSAVSLDDHIYVLMKTRSVYRLKYSDETARWEEMAGMEENHGRCPPATVLSGCIYVISGHYDWTTKSVEKYDPALNQWIKIADKPQPSQFSEVLASQGYIYSFGGKVGGTYTNKVGRFDPTSSTWTELAPMKQAKGYLTAVEMDEKIYVLGGEACSHLHSVKCYDLNTSKWTTLKPMKTARSWFRAIAFDGNIYAVGGYNSSPDSIEKFDPAKNEWEMVQIPGGNKLKILESVGIKLPS